MEEGIIQERESPVQIVAIPGSIQGIQR